MFTTVSEPMKSAAAANFARMGIQRTRMTSMMGAGYRLWVDNLTASVEQSARTVQALGHCRSLAEVVSVQREWLNATAERTAANLQAMVDLAQGAVETATETSVPNEAAEPVAPAPVVDAAPCVEAQPVFQEAQPVFVEAQPVLEEQPFQAYVPEQTNQTSY